MAQANKVFVTVAPDTTDFKADLRKFLVGVEATVKFNLGIDVNSDGLKEKLQAAVDAASAETDNAQIDAEANTTEAAAKLDELTRPRDVSVTADSSKFSMADIENKVSAAAQKIGRISFGTAGIGALASLALSASAGLLTMAGSLSSLVAFAAPVPGLLLAAATSIVVLVVALKDASTQLASLNPKWKALAATVQSNFWAKAKTPILDLVNTVFPQLKSGLASVSTAMGGFVGSVATGFQKAFGPSTIQTITGPLAAALRNAQGGTGALAQAFVTLGTFGSRYLPAIGTEFASLGKEFNSWIQGVVSSGALAGWVGNAVIIFKQLEGVASSALDIITGLIHAASASGSTGLEGFAGGLSSIAAVINGPAFQTGLAQVFQGASTGAADLAKAMGPIGSLFSTLAPAIGSALATLAGTASTLISGVADALNQPIVATGLTDAVNGISDGFSALLPALPGLASALGPVLALFGALASSLGQGLSAALQAVSPVIQSLATALVPVAEQLGPLLAQEITALAPLFLSLANQMLPLVQAILPLLVQGTEATIPLIGALIQIVAALLPVITLIVQGLSAAFVPALKQVASTTAAMSAVVSTAITWIQGFIATVGRIVAAFAPAVGAALNLGAGFRSMSSLVASASAAVTGAILRIVSVALGLAEDVGRTTGEVISAFTGLQSRIVGAFAGAASWLAGIGGDIIQGLVRGIEGAIGDVKGALSNLTKLIPSWKGPASLDKVLLTPNGKLIMGGLINGINSQKGALKSTLGAITTSIPSMSAGILGAVGSSSQARSGVTNNWTINEVTDPIGTAQAVLRRQASFGV